MSRIKIAAFTVFITLSSNAFAESASSVIKAFGLVGVWSRDCSVDLNQSCSGDLQHCVTRIQFEATYFGSPTEEFTLQRIGENGPLAKTAYKLKSAERVTDDKVKTTYLVEGRPDWQGPPAFVNPVNGEMWESVYKKAGDKIQVWTSQRIDGQKVNVRNGHRTVPGGNWDRQSPVKVWDEVNDVPLWEKCAN